MKCSLIYMDFEGRSDARSIKSILSHMAPLKLVSLLICFFVFPFCSEVIYFGCRFYSSNSLM